MLIALQLVLFTIIYNDSMEDTLIGEVKIFGDYHPNCAFGKFVFEVI